MNNDRPDTEQLENDVVIAGAGAVCSAGVGLPALLAAAEQPREGQSGQGGNGRRRGRAGVDDAALGIEGFVPSRRLRRLGRSARMMLTAARAALCGLDGEEGLHHSEVGLVCGTGVGALEETTEFMVQLRREGVRGASPTLFPNSVMSATAGYVSLELGLQGYSATVTQDALSGELAVIAAADALRLRRAPAILAGGVDELSEASEAVHRRAGGGSAALLGEGAAALLLRRCRPEAEQLSPRPLARLAGYAVAGLDGSRESPVARAASHALEMAGVSPADVAVIVARDDTARALSALLGDPGPEIPLVDLVDRVGFFGALGGLNVALAAGRVAAGLPNALVCGQTSSAPVSSSCDSANLAAAVVLCDIASSGSQEREG